VRFWIMEGETAARFECPSLLVLVRLLAHVHFPLSLRSLG
jgi:hypothetical protein